MPTGHPSAPPDAPAKPRLVVFADDWGRHPSSAQHLARCLLDRYAITWVNTIGTRLPRLSREDLGKTAAKLHQWTGLGPRAEASPPPGLSVLNPLMVPGFRRPWQRRINARLIHRAVARALGPPDPARPTLALTTLPVTADLPDRLGLTGWLYYCVDDFSAWPGLDSAVLDAMERQLVAKADAVMAVSETLRRRVEAMGGRAEVVPHGIDAAHWAPAGPPPTPADDPPWWPRREAGPVLLFWGVVDRRLDSTWCLALAAKAGSLVLLGPHQSPDPAVLRHPGVTAPGPVPYAELPRLAQRADVLVMPYADAPVTRAMQPLKFKEYLATHKPAVVRALPATRPWADAADVVETPEALVHAARERVRHGLTPAQRTARERLAGESWDAKAQAIDRVLTEILARSDPAPGA